MRFARQGTGPLCAQRSRAGFTLTEALATVLIVGLVTLILTSGVALATRNYTQSMVNSEAQMLYSSLQRILDTELRYTEEITESGGQVTGFSSLHYKAQETTGEGGTSSFTETSNLCTVSTQGSGVSISSPSVPGQLAMASSFDEMTAVFSPFLGSGAYNYGLEASIRSLTYVGDSGRNSDSGYFVVNLVISRGGNPGTAIVDETFTVKAMNLYDYTKNGVGGGDGIDTPSTGEDLTEEDKNNGWREPTNDEETVEVANSSPINDKSIQKLNPGMTLVIKAKTGTIPPGTTLKLFLLTGKNGNGKVLAVIEVTFNSEGIAEVVLPSVTNNGSLTISLASSSGIDFEAKEK